MKEIFKKLIAVIIVVNIFVFSCFVKTSAAMILAPAVEYLVPFLKTVLVASGMYAADEVENMTDELIFDAAGELGGLSAEKWAEVAKTVGIAEELQNAVNTVVAKDAVGNSYLDGFALGSWIANNQDVLDVYKGCGAIARDTFSDGSYIIYYCDYGLLFNDSGYIEFEGMDNIPKSDYSGFREYYNANGELIRTAWGLPVGIVGGSWALSGDWHFEDGTIADDIVTDAAVSSIGTVTIDGIDYPVNPDGTVTINGIDYPINPDGTVTYNNNVYAPAYNITNNYDDDATAALLASLINAIAALQLVTPEDDTEDLPITDAVLPDAIAASDLAGFQVPTGITSVFPFCIPFDVYRGIKLLSADPVAPYFEIPFEIPEIGVFPGYSTVIVLDFAKYDKYFKIVRWTMYFIAVMGICFMSFKIVKGNT